MNIKTYSSPDFNYIFNPNNGFTAIWGKSKRDNPDIAPFPLIVDMEITTICAGYNGILCPFCYKSNTKYGHYMTLPLAQKILDKLPSETTQIAFGVDAACETNPVAYEIFSYAKKKGFVPNMTIARLSDNALAVSELCGAVAVSRYEDKNVCYNTVQALTKKVKQVNIHMLLSNNTLAQAYETVNDILTDDRLQDLYAIIFLSLKQKGRGEKYQIVTEQDFKHLVEYVQEKKIRYGFDSCTGYKFLRYCPEYSFCTECCESGLQSAYINVDGLYFPCSFLEGTSAWMEGIKVLKYSTFAEVWNHPKNLAFKKKLLDNHRKCLVYSI